MIQLGQALAKAKTLVNGVIEKTIKVYDPSKNKIVVSGIHIDGIVKATVTSQKVGDSQGAVDPRYFSFFDTWENILLDIEVLPTAKSVEILQLLFSAQQTKKGYSKISITENGKFVGVFLGYITTLPSIDLSVEPENKTYQFILYKPQLFIKSGEQ